MIEHQKRSLILYSMIIAIVVFLGMPVSGNAVTVEDMDRNVSERDTSFYRDFFDSVIYDSTAGLFRFDELWNRISFRKKQALDINVYDEVPDSGFFVNRHGKRQMSISDLKRGPETGAGPDPNGPWRVIKGKVEGVSAGFFIEDSRGDQYLLKFDPKSNPEMATSAETISHKFFYAFGYHIPEYYLIRFDPSILSVDPKATYYDEDGFKKPLTQEALWELIERIPKMKGGLLRASASKLIRDHKGYMDFDGRRRQDPKDLISHEDRRSIRALRVFGSWLNHYDLRKGNTLDAIESENGEAALKHYLIDFGSTLGSAADHPKVPVAGYEHIVDWFEIGEAIPTLKVVEKSWEKKWDKLNRTILYPSLGYFDNYHFDPAQWKTQLQYGAFNELTAGDAFWAAKIITGFTDEEIREVVSTAEFSDPKNAEILSEILIARRDIIGKYWFSKTVPLDDIRLFHSDGNTYEITFRDLSVEHGYVRPDETIYRYRMSVSNSGKTGTADRTHEFTTSSFAFEAPVLHSGERAAFQIQLKRGKGEGWRKPPLKLTVALGERGLLELVEIDHGK